MGDGVPVEESEGDEAAWTDGGAGEAGAGEAGVGAGAQAASIPVSSSEVRIERTPP